MVLHEVYRRLFQGMCGALSKGRHCSLFTSNRTCKGDISMVTAICWDLTVDYILSLTYRYSETHRIPCF